MDDFNDDAICDDAAIADMNREYACRRSRENALDPDAGRGALPEGVCAVCRECAATLTFCLDYCSDDREREILVAAADTLAAAGGQPSAPPADRFSRSPQTQVKTCAARICRAARSVCSERTPQALYWSVRLLCTSTELMSMFL